MITLLITEELKNSKPLESVFKTLSKLKGSFALGIIFKDFPDIIIGARRGSPLAVGYSNEENYLGSDSYALKSMTNKISYLDDGELCMISKSDVSFFDTKRQAVDLNINPSFKTLRLLSCNVFPVDVISVTISEDPIKG